MYEFYHVADILKTGTELGSNQAVKSMSFAISLSYTT